MFDAPDSDTRSNVLLFFAINAYPVYLLPLAYYNSRLFQKNRILGSILPVLMILFLLLAMGFLVFLIGWEHYQARIH